MKQKILLFTMVLLGYAMSGSAQNVTAKAYYTDKEGKDQESTSVEEQAPLTVTFRANPTGMGGNNVSYEWHFQLTKATEQHAAGELFVRYEEDTQYTFNESGTYNIELRTYVSNTTGGDWLDPQTITVTIAESKLEFPNAFSPNGDGINDVYRAKKDYKSIVSFRAIILNRWGQKLYEWDDPAGGWDGTYKGNDVKQGVYFVFVQAKGADGKDYKIRKDVNLLRGYTDEKNTGGGGNEQ